MKRILSILCILSILALCEGCMLVRPTATITWIHKDPPPFGDDAGWKDTTVAISTTVGIIGTIQSPFVAIWPFATLWGTSAVKAIERSGGEVVHLTLPVPMTGAAEITLRLEGGRVTEAKIVPVQ